MFQAANSQARLDQNVSTFPLDRDMFMCTALTCEFACFHCVDRDLFSLKHENEAHVRLEPDSTHSLAATLVDTVLRPYLVPCNVSTPVAGASHPKSPSDKSEGSHELGTHARSLALADLQLAKARLLFSEAPRTFELDAFTQSDTSPLKQAYSS